MLNWRRWILLIY
uniref:Uncharacterized protein n=1 Tax=Romanomermis culicivorax TaxID=13658 RepID=A0A915INC4_ROMCU